MPAIDLWFEYFFAAFAVVYIILSCFRLYLFWKQVKMLAQATATKKQATEQVAARNEKIGTRVEAIQETHRNLHQSAAELIRISQDSHDRIVSTIERLDAVAAKLRNDAPPNA